MTKISYKNIILSASMGFILLACANYKEANKTVNNEIVQANQCLNPKSVEFENDCYDLISYKNSIALLRLGRKAYYKGNYDEALKRYSLAKVRGNFYANTLLSELYLTGRGVKKNGKKALELLKEVELADPIAAYKLSNYYIKKKNYKKAIKLLEFASQNDVKKAQYELSKIYQDGKIIEMDMEKGKNLFIKYEDKSKDFIKNLYGI